MKQANENENKSLLQDIQGEVSAESAPLLQFITAHASKIAGVVLALLLVLGGMGIWKWYHGGKQQEAREELTRIESQLKGKDRDKALDQLAQKAPDSVKLFIYLSLAKSAQENGDPVLSADAYSKAAKLEGDSALAITAALGSAGSLLAQGEYMQGLALLQELETKTPEAAKSLPFQQMLAESAYYAGKLDLARKTYTKLAGEEKTPESAYFLSRAEAIAKEMAAKNPAPAAAD